MKRKIYSAFALAAAMMLVPSCSSDDEKLASGDSGYAEVSFNVFTGSAETRTEETFTQCAETDPDLTTLNAYLTLKNSSGSYIYTDEVLAIGTKANGEVTTHTIHLTKDDIYTVTDFYIADGKKGDAGTTIYYSAVEESSSFASFVPVLLEYDIDTKTLDPYTKPSIDLWVMCLNQTPVEEFVKPKLDINTIKTNCIGIFVDVCTEKGEDIVAEGNIKVTKQVTQTSATPNKSSFTGTPNKYDLGSGKYGYICYSDQTNINDNCEWFLIELTITNGIYSVANPGYFYQIVNLTDLLNYKEVDIDGVIWREEEGFLDVYICPKDECINAIELDEKFCNTSIEKLEKEGWELPANASLKKDHNNYYLLVPDTECKETNTFTIKTPLVIYKEKQELEFKAFAQYIKEGYRFDPNHMPYACIKATISKGDYLIWAERTIRATEDCKFNEVEFFDGACIPAGCYFVELEVTMPYYVKDSGCVRPTRDRPNYNEVKWWEIVKFGIDDIQFE